MSWRAALVWWLVCSAAGVTLLVLPDTGPQLITFSEAHGPGLLDSASVVLLLVGTFFFWRHLWRGRASFIPIRPMWTFALGLGAGLVIASVLGDFGAWWAVGAALLVLVQAVLFARTVHA